MNDIKKDPFEEYIKITEPAKRELGYAWYTAMGLQAVDGLETSDYLKSTARKNIEGKITLEQDIETQKQDIGKKKKEIVIPAQVGNKTKKHIHEFYEEYGYDCFLAELK